MFTHVLVPVDGSAHAERAVDCAAELCKTFGARLTLIYIANDVNAARMPQWLKDYVRVEHLEITEVDMLLGIGRQILARAVEQARAGGATTTEGVTEVGDPAEVICAYAEDNDVDLIVMGRRGLGGLSGLLMGSVSHKVAHMSRCICMTVV